MAQVDPTAADLSKYQKAKEDRDRHVRLVVESEAEKRLVVAGPGTGKTHLFKQILVGVKKSLTLTFVNALVDDLSLELNGLSEVRTLHSYARSLLTTIGRQSIRLSPVLPLVLREDARILLGKEIDFDHIIHNCEHASQYMPFYRARKIYYGDYRGFADVIFEAAEYVERHPEKTPRYDLIVVDEFQDFNQLEVWFLEMLARKNRVLVAGDDDQALYVFKSASPDHIRSRYTNKHHGYEPFTLPYCARCSRVIVEAANDVIETATRLNLLKSRIPKTYLYFEDEKKDAVNVQNPQIIYSQLYFGQVAWFVSDQIARIAKELRDKFSVLVISPTSQFCRHLATQLRKKGFGKIDHNDRRPKINASLLDGLRIVKEDSHSNLGWRIVARHLLGAEDFATLLKRTENGKTPVLELLGREMRKQTKGMVAVLRKIEKRATLDDECIQILRKLNLDPFELVRGILTEEMDLEAPQQVDRAIRNIPVTITTIESSKGLAADYVFITNFDDQYFVKDRNGVPTDKEICNFLVALTRARRRLLLVSTKKTDPTFLGWIKEHRIQRI